MQVLVQKYGGTSVGTLERIAGVAEHIKNSLDETRHKLVVVVSAMGTFTDELVDMGKALHPYPPKREFDMLLTAGERISAALLSIALDRIGIRSLSLTGSQSGILTDEVHGNARITKIMGKRILEELNKNDVVIIAGFQGVSPLTKDVTTLGRGGSDLTALALAISLDAEACEIYTDVPGVMTADPRKVSDSKVIKNLSWEIMGVLAAAGAGVVHHRAALVAQKYKMPFEIRSSQDPTKVGTTIKGNTMETPHVVAVTSKQDQALIRFSVNSEKIMSKLLSQGLQWLWKQEQSPSLFRSFHHESFGIEAMMNSSLLKDFFEHEKNIAEEEGYKIGDAQTVPSLSMITVVGVGFRHAPEIVHKVLECFDVMPKVFEVKDHFILISVSAEDENRYVNKLHNTFFNI